MRAKRLRDDERGSAVVEFALAVPALLLLLVAVMQLGILLHANGGIRELMGWSGRTAMILYQNSGSPPSDDSFKALVRTEAGTGAYGLDPSRLTTGVAVSTNTASGVRSVTITLRYTLTLPLPLLPPLSVGLNQSRTYFAPV